MSSQILVGSYILDTLQTYFAWDDDLYTYFKERGLGQSGMLSKKLPSSTPTIAKAQPEYMKEKERM